jgi:hypothetical protein
MFHKIRHGFRSGNVVVTEEELRTALSKGVFTGFDEVWIFTDSPPIEDMQTLPSATSESTDFDSALPQELLEFLETTSFRVILGDGCGLNYATRDREIAELLISSLA